MAEDLFTQTVISRGIPRTGLTASAGVHAGILGFLALWPLIGPSPGLNFHPKNYELQIIHYNLPEPLLFASSGRKGGGGGSRGGQRGGSAGKSGSAGSRQPGRTTISLPAGAGQAAANAPAPAKTPSRPSQLPPAPGAPSSRSAASSAAPKPAFELPPRPVVRRRDLVIQPQFDPGIQISGKVQLPNLFLWSQQQIQAPARQLKSFTPGETKRAAPRSPAALPDAAPKVEMPNEEVRVTDLKIATQLQAPERHLPVFAGTTAPVRIRRQNLDAPSELPASALPAGQPVNLLALMEHPAPPSSSYTVEGGNRFPSFDPGAGGANATGTEGNGAGGSGTANGGGAGGVAGSGSGSADGGVAGGGAGGGGGAGSGAGGGGTSGTGSGSGTSGTGTGSGGSGIGTGTGNGSGSGGRGNGSGSGSGIGPGSGSGRGAGSGPGSGAGGSGGGSGSGTGGSGTGAGSRRGGAGTGLDLNGLRIGSGSVALQEEPNTSSFEVVIVHPNPRDVMPESPGILTGQPIYTVYMAVPGSRQEWIVQYAVPNSREPVEQRTENSVQLGAATPVRPPFPLRKASLGLTVSDAPANRVVLYGDISEKGVVENLRVVKGVRSEVDAAVMACVRQFLFRPAVRDGVPILVEALFGVPIK